MRTEIGWKTLTGGASQGPNSELALELGLPAGAAMRSAQSAVAFTLADRGMWLIPTSEVARVRGGKNA